MAITWFPQGVAERVTAARTFAPRRRETQSAPKARSYARIRTHDAAKRMADAAGVAAVLQPARRAPAAQERFKWTPKQSFSYLATFFIATWLGAFLITFLLVQVLLRMS